MRISTMARTLCAAALLCTIAVPSPAAAAQDDVQVIRSELENALRAAAMTLRFREFSNMREQPEAEVNPFVVGFQVGERERPPSGIPEAVSVSFVPTNVVFTVGWLGGPLAAGRLRASEEVAEAFLARTDEPCGRNNVGSLPYTGASCIGSVSGAGANDPNFSGDPYTAEGRAWIASSCLDIGIRVTLAVWSAGSHGARNKPDVMESIRQTAEQYALEVSDTVWNVISSTCGDG
ncbi:MAG: hypothetical protein HW416_3350 [Chloroflexi bacterium]|nr:hypothetical protein [Chloroflexota bacterium]